MVTHPPIQPLLGLLLVLSFPDVTHRRRKTSQRTASSVGEIAEVKSNAEPKARLIDEEEAEVGTVSALV